MGRDKAKLIIEGQCLFDTILALLQSLFGHVFIAGDRQDLTRPGITAIPDVYPGSSLGGLHTGLQAAETDWMFVAPCDMPYPDARIVQRLLAARSGVDAVVPRTANGYEPVFALYHKNCLPQMEAMLKQDQYRILDFYQRIKIRYLDPPDLPEGWERSLINLNTPDQLASIKEKSL